MINIPFFIQIPVAASMESAMGHDIVQMIVHAGLMVRFVLGILLAFSVICWAIILMKFRLFRRAKMETESFMDLFWEGMELTRIYRECDDLRYSPVARLFKSGYAEFSRIRKIQSSSNPERGRTESVKGSFNSQQAIMDNLDRSLKKASIDQANRLERALSFLATTGNTAPFIGLFGTVWGIMESFRSIGLRGSANLAAVAPGISEALIATAAGLAAAIPAVVAFNYFTNRVSALRAEMDIFTSDFLSMMERQFFKTQKIARTSP